MSWLSRLAERRFPAARRAHLASLTDAGDRKSALAKLARLELRQAIAEDARHKYLR